MACCRRALVPFVWLVLPLSSLARGDLLIPPTAHDGKVTSMAVVSDELIASGSEDGTVRVWNRVTGRAVARYDFGGNSSIEAIASHPLDSNLLAIGVCRRSFSGCKIRLFDLSLGETIRSWDGQAATLAFSPDGRFLAGLSFSILTVWQTDTGELYVSLQANGGGLTFADNGEMVYFGEAGIQSMDLTNGQVSQEITLQSGGSFVLSQAANTLFYLDNKAVEAWEWSSGQKRQGQELLIGADQIVYEGEQEAVFAASFRAPLLAQTERPLHEWSQATNELRYISGADEPISHLFAADSLLHVGQSSGRIERWRIDGDQALVLPELGLARPSVSNIALSSDDRYLAIGDRMGVVDFWDVESASHSSFDPFSGRPGLPEPRFGDEDSVGYSQTFRVGPPLDNNAVGQLRFSPSGFTVAIGYRNNALALFDVLRNVEFGRFEADEAPAGVHFLDEDTILFGTRNKAYKLDRSAPADAVSLELPVGRVSTVASIPSESMAIVVGHKRAAIVDTNGWQVSRVLEGFDSQWVQCAMSIGNEFLLVERKGVTRVDLEGNYVEAFDQRLSPGKRVRCDGKNRRTISSAPDEVVIHDYTLTSASQRTLGNDREALGIALANSADVLLSAGKNGRVSFYDISEDRRLGTLLNLGSGSWIARSGQGAFAAPSATWPMLAFQIDGQRLRPAGAESRFVSRYTPELLHALMKGKVREVPSIAARTSRPPDVKILSPQPTYTVSAGLPSAGNANNERGRVIPSFGVGSGGNLIRADGRLGDSEVEMVVQAVGDGLRECRLFRNRQLYKSVSLNGGQREVELRQRIPLVRGDNELSVYCLNADGVPSETARTVVVTDESVGSAGRAFIVSIAVDKYRHKDILDLRYAKADSHLVVAELDRSLRTVYNDVYSIEVLDEHATSGNVARLLRALADGERDDLSFLERSGEIPLPLRPEDGLFIFYAGHGEAAGGQYRLLLHNAAAGQDDVAGKIMDAQLLELLENVPATDVFLAIDACQSGAAIDQPYTGPYQSRSFAQLAYDRGAFVVTAAQSDEFARELQLFGHGLFTHVMFAEGLRDRRADTDPENGTITARELINYAVENIQRGQSLAKDQWRQARGMAVVGKEFGGLLDQRPKAFIPPYGFKNDFRIVAE